MCHQWNKSAAIWRLVVFIVSLLARLFQLSFFSCLLEISRPPLQHTFSMEIQYIQQKLLGFGWVIQWHSKNQEKMLWVVLMQALQMLVVINMRGHTFHRNSQWCRYVDLLSRIVWPGWCINSLMSGSLDPSRVICESYVAWALLPHFCVPFRHADIDAAHQHSFVHYFDTH